MVKSNKSILWNVLLDAAIILASIQIVNYVPIPNGFLGVIIPIIILFLALGSKYYFDKG